MHGVVKAIIRKREGQNGGYFFVTDPDGHDRFAHARNLMAPATFPVEGVSRDSDIREGQEVDFEPVEIPNKGLRADKVTV
jgi:cold shock CspA family protein